MAESGNRVRKLAKDVGVYALGNIGSKLITFMMIPLYTYFINAADFGYYDLCLNVIFLMVPFATLQLKDGSFRFLMDGSTEEDYTKVISVSFNLLFRSLLTFILIALVASFFIRIHYFGYSLLLLVSMSLFEIYGQVARGVKQTTVFVVSNIISAFSIGIFSVLFVVVLKMGLTGIFLANIVARIVAIVYIEIRLRLCIKYFKFSSRDSKLKKDLLAYSLPLLPGVICWWLTGSSDRFFIEHFLSLTDNGIYAVALRFVSFLQILATIFYQAWQETALQQYGSQDRNVFFSDVFNGYIHLLSIIFVLFAFGLKLNYSWLVAPEYQESKVYLYPLGIAALLFALSAFLDMGYQCARETAKTLPAIIAAAVANVVLNYLLVPLLGIWGVVITAIVSYSILLGIRIHDMRRYFVLKFYLRSMWPLTVCLVGFVPFYLVDCWWLDICYVLVALLVLAITLPVKLRSALQTKLFSKKRLQD